MSMSPTSAIATIHNTSTRPDPEVRALLEFALAETGDQGVRRVGRWPLYRVHDWREHLVNLGAHELYHIIEYDRDRPGNSEVACELFAERVLDKYRLTNATALGMLLVPSMTEGGQAMSTAVAEPLSAAVTPNATVVRQGNASSTEAKPHPKPSDTGKKVTRRRTTTKTAGDKPKRVSALAAAELILKRSKEPLHVNEITKRIQRMEGTNLKGKTPEASVGAILAVNLKQKDTPFKRTAPSTYTLKKK